MNIPFDIKLTITKNRIKEWYKYWNGKVYVAFSGGKDSTVLLHLVRSIYPDIEGVFCNTGMEYPEILQFVRTVLNIMWLKPKMNFKQVIEKYGYPVISKKISMGISRYRNTKSCIQKYLRLNGGINPSSRKIQQRTISKKWHFLINAPFKISERCCDIMKKTPFYQYNKKSNKKAFVGTMIVDSDLRKQSVKRYGCNAFKMKHPQSRPLSLWNENDIWKYIKMFNLTYSKIYDIAEIDRTGCVFCMFGTHLEKKSRFDSLKKTHLKLYDYCMNELGIKDVLDYINNKVRQNQIKMV